MGEDEFNLGEDPSGNVSTLVDCVPEVQETNLC